MTEKLIIEKLSNLEKQNVVSSEKIDRIEIAVGVIAVQSERIDNISGQVNALWEKHDEAFGQDGVVNRVKLHQAGCPRDTMKSRFKELWAAYALLASALLWDLFKSHGGK